MQQVRVALIGYGYLGKWHAQKIEALSESQLVAIVECDPEKQLLAKQNHPNAQIVDDLNKVMGAIDAGVIASPTSTHFTYIEALLKAKKHIFCEKPLCAVISEADRLEKILSQTGYSSLVLQCGHSERFHAVWEYGSLREICKSADFVIETNRSFPFAGRALDVDVVQDLMIHDLDLLNYLLRQTPISVRAKGFKLRSGYYDTVWAELHYENGGKALLKVNRDAVKADRVWSITTPKKSCFIDLTSCESNWTQHGEVKSEITKESYAKRDHLLVQHQLFYQSILNQQPPVVSFLEGLKACRLAFRVVEAIQNYQAVCF